MQAITYHFKFSDGHSTTIDFSGMSYAQQDLPSWTALSDHQCPNCPLSGITTKHCPMAVSMIPLMQASGNRNSYDQVEVEVETPDRHYRKSTTVQAGTGSLMGLLSATSGCPNTDFLKGMAEFHLPFSNARETLYRSASTYLLVQYLMMQKGSEPDWELKNLRRHYDNLQIVNLAFANRLRAASEKDGAINALIILDSLAKTLQFSIDDALEIIQPLFEYYKGMTDEN